MGQVAGQIRLGQSRIGLKPLKAFLAVGPAVSSDVWPARQVGLWA